MITIECVKCENKQKGCCGNSSIELFQGLIITDNSQETKIYAPYEVHIHDEGSVTLTDLKGNRKTVSVNDTVEHNTLSELVQFIKSCKCASGTGVNEVETNYNISTGVLTVTVDGVSNTTNLYPLDIVEITDSDLATSGSPETSDVVTFVSDNNYLHKQIVYAGDGSVQNPDFAWMVDKDGDVTRVEKLSGAVGGAVYTYKVGESYIIANGLGVNYAKSNGTGTFSVPDGVKLLGGKFWGVSADLSSNAFTFVHDHSADNGGSPTYDLDDAQYIEPIIQKTNESSKAASGLDTAPFTVDTDSDPQVQTLSVSGGVYTGRIINLNGLPYWSIRFSFT